MLQTASTDRALLSRPVLARLVRRAPQITVVMAVLGALCAAAIGPAAVGGRATPPPSRIVAERTIGFHDRADGAVVATEGTREIAVFEGEQGFVRGILRSMARQRRGEGMNFSQPFHLAAWADGRITLDDLATGERLDLEAFGSTNAAVFAALLPGLQSSVPPVTAAR